MKILSHALRPLGLILVIFLCYHALLGVTEAPARRYQIILGEQSFLQNGRIVGFEINVKAGRFASAPSIPIGWGIKIDDDASWQCSASGLVAVGAAAMSKEELENLFVIVAAPDTQGPPEVNVVVHTTTDFERSTKHMLAKVPLKALSDK